MADDPRSARYKRQAKGHVPPQAPFAAAAGEEATRPHRTLPSGARLFATLPFAGARLTAGFEWGRSPRLFAGLSVTVDRDLSTQTITHSWTETHRPLLCFSEPCSTTSTETETVTFGQLNVTVTLLNVRIVYN